MNKFFVASISWISFEEGGRKIIPPKGTRYCPLIHLNDEMYCADWSIDFICPNFSKTNVINFKFLAKNAPYHLIKRGEKYEIYEGRKKVAKIDIIDCCSSN